MSAEHLAPIDEMTGMPLPILTPEDRDVVREAPDTNWHHHFHSSSDPALQTLGGKALRSSRLQLVPAELHNMGVGEEVYHRVFKGTQLPEADDTERQFYLCMLAAAGYVPRQAIDMRGDNPTEPVNMTKQQYERYKQFSVPSRITRSEIIRHAERAGTSQRAAWRDLTISRNRQAKFSYYEFKYSYEPMRNFFTQFLLDQDLDISSKAIKRFLAADDPDKRRALGDTILSQAADQMTLDFRKQYQSLHDSGALHPLMPATPDRLAFRKLGNYSQRVSLLPKLAGRLIQVVC